MKSNFSLHAKNCDTGQAHFILNGWKIRCAGCRIKFAKRKNGISADSRQKENLQIEIEILHGEK